VTADNALRVKYIENTMEDFDVVISDDEGGDTPTTGRKVKPEKSPKVKKTKTPKKDAIESMALGDNNVGTTPRAEARCTALCGALHPHVLLSF
jgi:hypothetical protein